MSSPGTTQMEIKWYTLSINLLAQDLARLAILGQSLAKS